MLLINREVCHLYSLQQMIALDDMDTFYPVNLATCLGHKDHYKSDWIQRTQLGISTSLNRAKSDLTHPVWSIVNKLFIKKMHLLLHSGLLRIGKHT